MLPDGDDRSAAHALRALHDVGRVRGRRRPPRSSRAPTPGRRARRAARPPPPRGPASVTATMPTPRFSVRSRSARGTAPEPGHEAEHRRRVARCRGRRRRGQPAGSTRARLAARPPPVTWREGVQVRTRGRDQVEDVRGVDPGRLEQLLAERAAELVDVPRRSAQPAPAERRAGRASSRWSAARWTRARARRRRRATRCGAEHVVGLDHADRGARDVVLVGAEQARVLRGLAADQGAAGARARRGDARRRWRRSARARPCRRRCSRS